MTIILENVPKTFKVDKKINFQNFIDNVIEYIQDQEDIKTTKEAMLELDEGYDYDLIRKKYV